MFQPGAAPYGRLLARDNRRTLEHVSCTVCTDCHALIYAFEIENPF